MSRNRTYTKLLTRIWQNLDWRNLTHHAQHLYILCLSHPTLTYAGVLDYNPKKLAALSTTTTPQTIETAAQELEHTGFLIIDRDTDEALIRSFHRNDETIRQPNLTTRAVRDIQQVASTTIHHHIAHEIHRLHQDHPQLPGWKAPEMLQYLHDTNQTKTENNTPPNNPPQPPTPTKPTNTPKRRVPQRDPQRDAKTYAQTYAPGVTEGFHKGMRHTGIPKHQSPSGLHNTNQLQPGADANSESAEENSSEARGASPASRRGLSVVAVDGQGVEPSGRCSVHEGLPEGMVPPCRACGVERRRREEWVENARKRVSGARRAAIEGCTLCDEFGWLKSPSGGVVRCDHGVGGDAAVG